ncbi:MAG TPA: DsbA family oxidoreductase [Stellaceae bacterium]|nr:DsbA family oxidoreductase [Stellaceae bacterium]
MRIDIVLDVICPWCFIGKRRLEQALAARPGIAPELAWHPFQLNPDMPSEGMARQDYLVAKFGGPKHAARIDQSICDAGATVGIAFAFERIHRTPNTREAHRLIGHAQAEDRADALVEALFRAYFLDGSDIGDRAMLVAIAARCGLDRAATARFLDGSAGLADVAAQDRGARRLGITAVPCFIFDGQYAISGAQEPEFFQPLIDLVENGAAVSAGAE